MRNNNKRLGMSIGKEFKIPRLHGRGGSSPPTGTNKKAPHFCGAFFICIIG